MLLGRRVSCTFSGVSLCSLLAKLVSRSKCRGIFVDVNVGEFVAFCLFLSCSSVDINYSQAVVCVCVAG